MKLRAVRLVATVLVLAACEDINGFRAVTGPVDQPPGAVLTGRWIGQMTAGTGVAFPTVPAELGLTQVGSSVTGDLIINNARAAVFTATLSGTQLTGTWTYGDVCGGSAAFSATVVPPGNRFSGTFTSTDCLGTVTGSFTFDRI